MLFSKFQIAITSSEKNGLQHTQNNKLQITTNLVHLKQIGRQGLAELITHKAISITINLKKNGKYAIQLKTAEVHERRNTI